MLMMEFNEQDSSILDEIMEVVKRYPDFECLQVKEYALFYLLVVNQGHVLTYNQIYQKIWGEDALSNESNTIKCHIRNLREKLYRGTLELYAVCPRKGEAMNTKRAGTSYLFINIEIHFFPANTAVLEPVCKKHGEQPHHGPEAEGERREGLF